MLVLAIDPGTVRMGYGVLQADPRPEAEDYGVVALPKGMPLEQRLYQLFTHVRNMISVFRPDVVAVEEPFVGRGDRRFVGPAIAVGQAGDTREAMSQLESLRSRDDMKNYLLLDCASARIHELEGNTAEAIDSYLVALSKAVAPHERALLERKLRKLAD